MRIVLGLAAVLLSATPAAARNWFLLSISVGNTTAIFIDRDSIVASGEGMVRAQGYSVHSIDDPDGTASREMTFEFDCTAPRYRFVRMISYDASLKRLRDEAGTLIWRPSGTDTSLIGTSRRFACSYGTTPAGVTGYGAENPFATGRRALGARSSDRPDT